MRPWRVAWRTPLTLTPTPKGACLGIESIATTDQWIVQVGEFSERPTTSFYDDWAVANFGPVLGHNAAPNADPDGDGSRNKAERAAGTDPNDRTSNLRITDLTRPSDDPSALRIEWSSIPGTTYLVQEFDEITGIWQEIASVPATTAISSYGHTINPAKRRGFFRVAVEP